MLPNDDSRVVYGRLLEDVSVAVQYTARGQENLNYLLVDERWRELGFTDVNAFVASLDFSQFRRNIEERRQVVGVLTEAGASQRAIADALDVDQATVNRDRSNGRVMQHASPQPSDKSEAAYEVMHVASPEPTTNGVVVKDSPPMLTLLTHTGDEVLYPEPQGKPTFNQTQGDGISWARWSWNPVTGCLHGCGYCYAREIATSERFARSFPVGFTPLFHHERLDAPRHTVIPAQYRDDPAYRRVFVCSMADLYGRWVPREWIDKVHASMLASPEWEYLLLTKFPERYTQVELPPNAWVGTSVDEQKRVPLAERAFRKISGVKHKWLSLEPLLSPLEFSDLSMFDWVVIGAQTSTRQGDTTVPAFAPPLEWVARIYLKALESGCKVHIKPNITNGSPGLQWPDEYP